MRPKLGVLLVLSLTACSDPSTPAGVPETPQSRLVAAAKSHELGRSIYNFRCYFCHGYSGDGQTLASTYLNPKPRNFIATAIDQLNPTQMRDAVAKGRPGSAMQGFESLLTETEITAVVGFVRQEFMINKASNTRYHTPENGWPDHQRYAAAFAFATGTVTIDTPPEKLTPELRAGRRLFMSTCVSCHDRANVSEPGQAWESHALSYPRNGFVPGDAKAVDTISGASPYHLHDKAPRLIDLSEQELRGQAVFQDNCAFCHAADGTGRNWIGSFLQPHPRDLTESAFMSTMTHERLTSVIRDGLPGTSMPAWKSVLSQAQIQAVIAYISKAFHPLASAIPATGASGSSSR